MFQLITVMLLYLKTIVLVIILVKHMLLAVEMQQKVKYHIKFL